jgi:hypothetical protein
MNDIYLNILEYDYVKINVLTTGSECEVYERRFLNNIWLHCKLQTRPLVREGAPQKQDRKFQTATFQQEVISGRKSHKGTRYQDILTYRQS